MTNTIAIVLAALIRIESAGDPGAVGDGWLAVGVLQMWPCAVAEANRLAGRQLWTLDDRRNPQLSRAMAWTILEHHYRRGNTDAVALACRWRNPYSRCPEWYAEKVRRSLARAVTDNPRGQGLRSNALDPVVGLHNGKGN